MASDLRKRSLQILMDKIGAERYPSPTMLDRVEAAVADRQTAEKYVGLLLDNIERDRFPSPTMLDRIRGLIDALDRLDSSDR
jgi:hypothetical protein